MGREIYKDKYYTHFDVKKKHKEYEKRVEDVAWVGKHGFYPFIHFSMNFSKYTNDSEGNKYIKTKERDIKDVMEEIIKYLFNFCEQKKYLKF